MKQYLKERFEYLERITLLGAKEVLTIEDVCLYTGLAKSHIYRLTSEKLIPYYKPQGKVIFFDKKEIEQWCLQNRIGTIQEAEQKAIAYTTRKEVTNA